ncbi:MAG TPA: hypothetical protein VIU63_02855, partial [Nitrospira sp.]
NLLAAIRVENFRDGEWKLCERIGWPENQSCQNIVAWCWQKGPERHLVAVNLSPARAQAQVTWPWNDFAGRRWRLVDPVQMAIFNRDGDELQGSGLYVDLEPWGYHFLKIENH